MQIYKILDSIFSSLANALWGTPLVILLLGGGLFFAIYSRMVPILYFKHAIEILLGKKVKISFVKDRPGHDIRYALNSNKIKKKLKWKPKTKLSAGILKTVNWYLNNQNYLNNISKKLFVQRLGNR